MTDNARGGRDRRKCRCDEPVIDTKLAGPSGLRRDYCGKCKKLVRTLHSGSEQ